MCVRPARSAGDAEPTLDGRGRGVGPGLRWGLLVGWGLVGDWGLVLGAGLVGGAGLGGCTAKPGGDTAESASESDSAWETDTGGDTRGDSGDSGADTLGDTHTADTIRDTEDTAPPGPPAPEVETGEAVSLPLPTSTGLPPVSGFTVNTRIHPHGLPCTWTVEYGPTEAYGQQTEARALPGVLDAHFVESWDEGAAGWLAGIRRTQLSTVAEGGADGGPFVRYTDDGSYGDDTNHYDGIGAIHLGLYGYVGHFDVGLPESPPLFWGGGFPDLRGARFSMWLRGVDWEPHGTELGSWIQGARDTSVVDLPPEELRFPNWAFTGEPLGGHLTSGEWERAEWVLRNRSADWTFAGSYGSRLTYDYGELDTLLGAVNVDLFPIQILGVDIFDEPKGAIDYDQLEITYRQHSLLAPTNGGVLEEAPASGEGAEWLTDGWRFGEGREWRSADGPTGPQELRYSFVEPVTVWSVLVHNSPTHPSRKLRVEVSTNGGDTWEEVLDDELPEAHALGPNLLYVKAQTWEIDEDGVARWTPLYPEPVDSLRVVVESGWTDEAWGLGEIEAFGTGAEEATDDDWYDATRDVYVDPGTWHYRVCATTEGGTVCGEDGVVGV